MEQNQPVSDEKPEHRPTVLVVEDEIPIRMIAVKFLRDRGYRVLEASNSGEAQMLLLCGEQIDVVVTDVKMPGGMSGAALAQWIKQRDPNMLVILTTGGMDNPVGDGTLASEILVFRKPYPLYRLADRIDLFLAS